MSKNTNFFVSRPREESNRLLVFMREGGKIVDPQALLSPVLPLSLLPSDEWWWAPVVVVCTMGGDPDWGVDEELLLLLLLLLLSGFTN